MELINVEEFTNVHSDSVKLTLFRDSVGGFHLIVKTSRVRKSTQYRVNNGKMVEIPSVTHSEETEVIELPTERLARVEFNLYRVINNDPKMNNEIFQAWLRETEKD